MFALTHSQTFQTYTSKFHQFPDHSQKSPQKFLESCGKLSKTKILISTKSESRDMKAESF